MLRFNVLGPLEVLHDDRPVPLGGLNQRATLGLLLMNANAAVPVHRLVDALWGEAAPANARKIVQNAVSRLRHVVPAVEPRSAGSGWSITTLAGGYLMQVAGELLDTWTFFALVDRGRAAMAAEAWADGSEQLGAALRLWRGPVLADLAETGLDWSECTTLHEAGVSALEDRITADLMLGRDAEVANELMLTVAARPPRARLYEQLMLALYRSGRQADALDVYRRAPSPAGLPPDRRLERLQIGILTHDPALQSPDAARRFLDRRTLGGAFGLPPSAGRSGAAPGAPAVGGGARRHGWWARAQVIR
jgi:DNA-binding SARP family transcriptional activator